MISERITSLTDRDIFNIIEEKISNAIINSIKKNQILSELDFQFKILDFINYEILKNNDLRWKIHNCYYISEFRKFPDLVLFLDNLPVIFIEIKCFLFKNPNVEEINDDIKKLDLILKNFANIKKCYTINVYSCSEKKDKDFQKSILQIDEDKIEIINWNLELLLKDFDNYKKKYNQYLSTLRKNLIKKPLR